MSYLMKNDSCKAEVLDLSWDSQWKQVFLGQLQVIIITKPPEHSPCGLMPSSLNKKCMKEQET